MTEPTLDLLTERLDRLERETRRLNRGLLAQLVLVGFGIDALYRLAALQIWEQIVVVVGVVIAASVVDLRRLGKR
jgi:hypothetical protein